MYEASHEPLHLGRLLAKVEAAAPTAAVEAIADELAQEIDAHEVSFVITDISGQVAVKVSDSLHRSGGGETAEISLADTVYGRVLRTQRPELSATDGLHRLVVPVTNRGDVVGALEMVLDERPDQETADLAASAAHALAYAIVVNRQFTDLYEWGLRTTELTLAAEIQRRLLPAPLTCEAGPVTVAGWLEPAHDIGGDTFDYTLNPDFLHLSITDAMGHDVDGALLATLFVSSLRNSRRRGLDLGGQAEAASEALARYAEHGTFVTGQVARVDMATGAGAIVNAGHPLPFRMRDGGVERLDLEVDLPFGVTETPPRVQAFELRPGDRLAFITDGMTERSAARLDLRRMLERTAGLHPREVAHELTSAAVGASGGERRLRDDATVLCVDWRGPGERERWAPAGADLGRTSPRL